MIKKFLLSAPALGLVAMASNLPAQPVPLNGAQLFTQRCGSCHTVTAGGRATLAPNLAGIVGRKAASTSFATYSPALKNSKLVWTRANLDTYLSGPTKMVPGTRMVISVTNPQQRSAILDHLARPAAR